MPPPRYTLAVAAITSQVFMFGRTGGYAAIFLMEGL